MTVENAARQAIELTGRLIDSLGPRPSGSDKSRQAADALLDEANEFADKAWTEDFSVRPGAFLGWIRLVVLIYVIAVVLLWLQVFWLAALLATAGLVVIVAEFFFYRELIDPLFRRSKGRNVLAVVEPEGKARGQLIISGHHDSAFVFNFLVHQPKLYPLRVTGGLLIYLLLLIVCWVLSIWQVTSGDVPGWYRFGAALFSILFLLISQLWWFASSKSAPGAGDNLASSAAAWEALRLLAERKASGGGLQSLRVLAASWDAEEAGLRGARSWVKGAADGRLALPTWNLNLECLYDANALFLLTSDINGSVALSAEMAARCQRLLASGGQSVLAKPIAFLTGGTDAAELAKGGAQATCLMGMPWGNDDRSAVYHTPDDVLDSVDHRALEKAIGLALDLANELDNEVAAAATA